MSEGFKVGDRVRLTGSNWGVQGDYRFGTEHMVVDVDHDGWAVIDRADGHYVAPETDKDFEYWGGVVVTDEEDDRLEGFKVGDRVKLVESGEFILVIPDDPSKVPPYRDSCEFFEEPDPEPENSFATKVWAILDEIGNLLISKNEAYGDAALNPIRVFSKADTLEQLRVRIDDKLNRIKNGHEYANEDTVDDLIGYLVLYKVGSR